MVDLLERREELEIEMGWIDEEVIKNEIMEGFVEYHQLHNLTIDQLLELKTKLFLEWLVE